MGLKLSLTASPATSAGEEATGAKIVPPHTRLWGWMGGWYVSCMSVVYTKGKAMEEAQLP